MKRSKTWLRHVSTGLISFLIFGCGSFKSLHKQEVKTLTPDLKEVTVAAPKGDTVASFDLGLKKNDSTRTPSIQASELYLKTLDNYLKLAPDDEKVPEILLWKGNHLYEQNDFSKALEVYQDLRKRFPTSPMISEATQMSAQSYAQLGNLEEAEKTYRSMLKESNIEGQAEARERLSQSIYLQAEKNEKEGNLQAASEGYSRVAKEFATTEIAPVAMFNSGVMLEKQKKWKEAIQIYGLFFDQFFDSKLLPKVLFREAKCRELDGQWQVAGEKYLNLVRVNPESPDAEASLYNAGFAFFNAKLPDSAAKSFEAYAKKYPQNVDHCPRWCT